jgi:hypothetical protein
VNQIIEFLFCPIHGVFSPANMPLLSAAYTMLRDNLAAIYATYRYNQARNNGAF